MTFNPFWKRAFLQFGGFTVGGRSRSSTSSPTMAPAGQMSRKWFTLTGGRVKRQRAPLSSPACGLPPTRHPREPTHEINTSGRTGLRSKNRRPCRAKREVERALLVPRRTDAQRHVPAPRSVLLRHQRRPRPRRRRQRRRHCASAGVAVVVSTMLDRPTALSTLETPAAPRTWPPTLLTA